MQVNPTGAYELLFHIILYLSEPLIGYPDSFLFRTKQGIGLSKNHPVFGV